jgi:UDP-N-acetylglucosamine 2-epimerase (non-hydrolysing)
MGGNETAGLRPGSVAVVLGTRPEIVKLASVVRLLGPAARLIHTGQHYDDSLSAAFFENFGLPRPALVLEGVGGASRGRQVATIVAALTDEFDTDRPAAVIVQGDTNTTNAAAQATSYAGVPLVHVEAGLRSWDRAMPEEVNRLVVGALADLHCAPTSYAAENLLAEGVAHHRVVVTGNTVVEATFESLPTREAAQKLWADHGVAEGGFVVATIHRPENTDDRSRLAAILDYLGRLPLPVVVPAHPRTLNAIQRFELTDLAQRLLVIEPVDHPTFLGLASGARFLVSDSGGIQEECTVIKKPLVVIRNSTERPEAIEAGFAHLLQPGPALDDVTYRLLGDDHLQARLASTPSPYGDGKASERIVAAVAHIAASA